jgi:hypothetical protein
LNGSDPKAPVPVFEGDAERAAKPPVGTPVPDPKTDGELPNTPGLVGVEIFEATLLETVPPKGDVAPKSELPPLAFPNEANGVEEVVPVPKVRPPAVPEPKDEVVCESNEGA